MDPITLLNQIRKLQDELNSHAWVRPQQVEVPDLIAETIAKIYELEEPRELKSQLVKYSRRKPPRKPSKPRTRRTRKDPFENSWTLVKHRLEINPTQTAKGLLEELVSEFPDVHSMSQRRTLERRVSVWRQEQVNLEVNHRKLTLDSSSSINIFADLADIASRS